MRVNGVFVGKPSVLGTVRDEPVYSAIAKARVEAERVKLGEINLDGDDQADRRVHGGPDMAVYVYPAEHYEQWSEDGLAAVPGDLGENVSVTGIDERTVRVGDVWAWGDALVQVTKPRSPCFKLAMKTGRKQIIAEMIRNGRSGWYLRVLRPGEVPTDGELTLVETDPIEPTIAELNGARYAR
ncbi:MOSC domain-containing protein [Amycolatopsis sp. cg5]|uniref:MOSC domain-containing protein n=1 Tax=Amycolatopsis sp. cg5 TaxID=3238802 RepID=UPI0035246063